MSIDNEGTASKPAGSLIFSYTVQDDHKAHAAGHLFLGVASDKDGGEVHIWQQRTRIDEQGLTDILNGMFDFPFFMKASEYARQIVSNSHSKGADAVDAPDAVSYQEQFLNATQQHFESIHLKGCHHAAEKDEQGAYLLKSVQDAWSGWRSCVGV